MQEVSARLAEDRRGTPLSPPADHLPPDDRPARTRGAAGCRCSPSSRPRRRNEDGRRLAAGAARPSQVPRQPRSPHRRAQRVQPAREAARPDRGAGTAYPDPLGTPTPRRHAGGPRRPAQQAPARHAGAGRTRRPRWGSGLLRVDASRVTGPPPSGQAAPPAATSRRARPERARDALDVEGRTTPSPSASTPRETLPRRQIPARLDETIRRAPSTDGTIWPPPTPELARANSGDYYALLPGNTDAGWARLTDRYRSTTAGSRTTYERFWSSVKSEPTCGRPRDRLPARSSRPCATPSRTAAASRNARRPSPSSTTAGVPQDRPVVGAQQPPALTSWTGRPV